MSKRANPLRDWRGSHSTAEAAARLHMSEKSYIILEEEPRKSKVKSNRIIKTSQITHIPLEVLVDYLTETNTVKKESVTC